MKRIVICLGSLLLLCSFQIDTEADEVIRRKIENSGSFGIEAIGQPLYCVKSIPEFYVSRAFQPAWNESMAVDLLTELERAGDEGLNPSDYHLIALQKESAVRHKTGSDAAEYDLILTDAFLLYVSHLLSGKVNPATFDAEWQVARREGDPVQYLEQAVSTGDVSRAIESAIPKHETYRSMKSALSDYRTIEAVSWIELPEGATIKPGMADDRLPLVRDKLVILGDLAESDGNKGDDYDEALLEAVKRFQSRHGLDSEGEIGNKTRTALNVSPAERVDQLRANLERWRWLPQEFGDFYIKVNIANYDLEVIKNGEKVRTHKVIVGKSFRQTPVFSSKMQYLVLNPTWTIPPGILNNDVIPGIRKDPSYLAKKNIAVLDQEGNAVDPASVDWNGKSVRTYIYRQPAGPDNALGAVKFMFPNSFHVYLHDTPSRELFAKSERALSSGCIRVENPLGLAEYLLNDEVNYSREKIEKVVSTRKTQTVQLKEQPYVHLLYWTSWTNSEGLVQFRSDIYSRDEAVLEALSSTLSREL